MIMQYDIYNSNTYIFKAYLISVFRQKRFFPSSWFKAILDFKVT